MLLSAKTVEGYIARPCGSCTRGVPSCDWRSKPDSCGPRPS